jgi:hypothetical protein
LKKAIILASTLLSLSVSANPGTWTPSNTISKIIIENGIALIVITDGVPSNYIPAECNQPYNQVDLSTEHGKAVYSLALSAKMANQKVSLALNCNGSRPNIKLISLN